MPPARRALDRVLAATSTGIAISDAKTEGFPLTFVNAAFERMTGYSAADCVGRNCRFLQGPGTDPAAVAELSAALREGRDVKTVLLNYRADGTPFHNELRLTPVRDDDGEIVQVVGVQADVSDVVAAQEALARERDQAQLSLRDADERLARQERELAELRALHDALTPAEPPLRPHLELASAFEPAEHGVAGDFHLVTASSGQATVLVVGDVMGHGLEAAKRATFVRAALATFSRFTDDPVRLLEMANHSLIERAGTSAEFVTVVCASYDPATRRLAWASAGHPPPLALDSGAVLAEQAAPGLPLGIEIDVHAGRAEITLEPGEGVLLYTDGLPEARRAGDRRDAPRLGEERVTALLRELAGQTPARVVEGLRAAARAHAGGELADDLCLIAIRSAPAPAVALEP